MWKLWKEVLLPGRQQDAHGNWFTFTPADVAAAKANAEKMLKRGVPVPCVWEHQDVEAGDPEAWKARYAKYTFGHVGGARLNARGALELLHEGRDDRDRDQLLKTKFVSPKVYPSYSDSRGGTYQGTTVAHVAATPTPVQHWQAPFELSRTQALYLSYTPEGSPVADEGKKPDEGKKGGEGDGKASGIGAVIDALRDIGMNIPDEVTDEAGLVIAIKASGGKCGGADAGGGGDPDMDLDTPSAPGSGSTTSAGGPPMLMSTTDRGPAGAQAKAWAKDERKDCYGRIKALFHTGRITRPVANSLQRQTEAVEMSFTRDGEAVSPLHRKLAELEKLDPHTAWTPDGRSGDGTNLSVVGVPDSLTGHKVDAETVKKQEELAAQYSVQPTK